MRSGRRRGRNFAIARLVGIGGRRGRRAGFCHAVACLARRGYHIVRSFFAKQHPSKLGIVYVHVSRTDDGLRSVVSTHFPSIYGVFFHPFQKDFLAFHNTAGVPHIRRAPTGIYVKNDTRTVTADVLTFAVGVVETAAFTISLVAAAAVFAGCRRTQHHNVVFALTVCVALTVGPGMFTVPSITAVPSAVQFRTRIEGRNVAVIAVYTIGVTIHFSRIAIGSRRSLFGSNQLIQRLIQRATGNGIRVGAARLQGQLIIGIATRVEVRCVARQEHASLVTRAPVCAIFTTRHIFYVRRLGVARCRAQPCACRRCCFYLVLRKRRHHRRRKQGEN